jgi:hypothetical protein
MAMPSMANAKPTTIDNANARRSVRNSVNLVFMSSSQVAINVALLT